MKAALVIGCSQNVWNEVADAKLLLGPRYLVYCVKLAGVHYPDIFETWITLHPEFMDDYERQRRALGHPGGYEIVAPLKNEVGMHGEKGRIARHITYRWPGMTSSASSGIFGAKVALNDGCDRVILAGCPFTHDGGHFTRNKPWGDRECFVKGFERAMPHMIGKVRSMSGWSAEKLGYPTREWLMGEPSPSTQGAMPATA